MAVSKEKAAIYLRLAIIEYVFIINKAAAMANDIVRGELEYSVNRQLNPHSYSDHIFYATKRLIAESKKLDFWEFLNKELSPEILEFYSQNKWCENAQTT